MARCRWRGIELVVYGLRPAEVPDIEWMERTTALLHALIWITDFPWKIRRSLAGLACRYFRAILLHFVRLYGDFNEIRGRNYKDRFSELDVGVIYESIAFSQVGKKLAIHPYIKAVVYFHISYCHTSSFCWR